MPAKKGQPLINIVKKRRKRLFVCYCKKVGHTVDHGEVWYIKSESQIITWVRKSQNGESFEDYRGRWTKKRFSSTEEENVI